MKLSGMNLYQQPHRLLLNTGPPAQLPPPPAQGERTHTNYSSEANFDTNMVIILAALLCALIFALGINSIVRCALRCSRRLAFETADQAAARLATRGLKKSALRQIPVAVYGAGIRIPATECPICLGEFMDGEKVRILPKCHHGFHVKCIDIWLASHSSCPTCRHSLLEKPEPGDEDSGLSGGVTEISVTNSSGHGNLSFGSVDEMSQPIGV